MSVPGWGQRVAILCLLSAGLLAGCREAPPQPPADPPDAAAIVAEPPVPTPDSSTTPRSLVGRWASVRFEGPGCVQALEKLEIELTEGKTFALTAHLNIGGTPRTDSRSGTWHAEGETLTLESPGTPPLSSTYQFNAQGQLVIKDKQTDCYETYSPVSPP